MSAVALLTALVITAAPAGPFAAPSAAGELQRRQSPSDTTYGCIICHADKRRAFRLGVHSERGIRCNACHGGDPTAVEIAPAHRGQFLGVPSKTGTVSLCGSCHSDPNQMRQYGRSSGQVAEFRSSRHGQLLLGQGNEDAPTCTDCHDAHTVLRPEDARSRVHPMNIPLTCGRCHDDRGLMAKYGLPADEYTRYRESAHGVALFEQENFAAPTCIGCHGSHAALPPGVNEIVNVCSHCHVLLGQEFNRGPHGPATQSGQLPGCLGCHSNHGTERLPPEEIAALCRNCHSPESPAALQGVQIQEGVLRATEALAAGRHAIDELVAAGRNVSDERFRYQAALTEYGEIAKVQHSLDMEHLEDLGLRVRSNIEIVESTAEVVAEERWEHKLLLVPVWFLTLSAVLLAWFKLRTLRQ